MNKKILLSAIGLLLLATGYLVVNTHYQANQAINLTKTQLLTVEEGSSFHQFSRSLVKKDWLDNRFWLRSYVRIYPELAKIKAGTYQVTANISMHDLLVQVVAGKEHQFSITFVEGTSLKQWIALLAKTENIKHEIPAVLSEEVANEFSVSYVTNAEKMTALAQLAQQFKIENGNPEGYFYPDTYAFSLGDSDIDILKRAYNKMLIELDKRWQSRDINLPYKTKHEALTMASIIEKESGRYAEHEIIASVFINRIHKKMRLQTDPTVIYGLGENYFGDIKFSHLRAKTPYNTRKIKALPPTPIAMPGKNALDAAFSPASTNYLYFVSNGAGEHVFSTNLADHNRAVAQYQLKKKK